MKNIKNKNYCLDCGIEVCDKAKRCRSCGQKLLYKEKRGNGWKKGDIKGYKWKKGQSGNPNGRLKGTPLSEKNKRNISKSKIGKQLGEESSNWKGGRKLSIERANAKRRMFSSIFLNDWFIGCEAHHIDKEFVIHIPKEMHRSIYHSIIKDINMDKINNLAIDFCYGGF